MQFIGQRATNLWLHTILCQHKNLCLHSLLFVDLHSSASFMAAQTCACHVHMLYWCPRCSPYSSGV